MGRSTKATSKPIMTGDEYRKTLAKLGLNIQDSATFLQIERSTSRRRANNHAKIGFETAALLRLMVKLDLTPDQVASIVDKP